MARTLAELETMRDTLEEAMFSGLRTVGYDDYTVTYSSISEQAFALRALNRKIQETSQPSIQTVRFSTSKGL